MRRSSARRTERGWHAAYIVALILMAVTTEDKVIRFLLTATTIGAAYNLGRKSEKEKSRQ